MQYLNMRARKLDAHRRIAAKLVVSIVDFSIVSRTIPDALLGFTANRERSLRAANPRKTSGLNMHCRLTIVPKFQSLKTKTILLYQTTFDA